MILQYLRNGYGEQCGRVDTNVHCQVVFQVQRSLGELVEMENIWRGWEPWLINMRRSLVERLTPSE